jgi:hypothetical protein
MSGGRRRGKKIEEERGASVEGEAYYEVVFPVETKGSPFSLGWKHHPTKVLV